MEAAEKSLLQAGVVTRAAKVQKVSEGRPEPACADVGKKLALDIGGKRETEHSDLVLWTAGAASPRPAPAFNCRVSRRERTSWFFVGSKRFCYGRHAWHA